MLVFQQHFIDDMLWNVGRYTRRPLAYSRLVDWHHACICQDLLLDIPFILFYDDRIQPQVLLQHLLHLLWVLHLVVVDFVHDRDHISVLDEQ